MDQLLQVFVTVADKKSFSRAAEELHMTQPAVSQYIQNIEREIGTRLLERNNKFVGLTQAGEIVYHYAKEIIHSYTKMQRLVDDIANKTSGPITIGASYTFGEYVLPRIIFKMLDQFPLIKPNVTIANTKEIAEQVHGHQLDVGIIEGDFSSDKMVIEPFAEDQMSIVMSCKSPLAMKKKITIADLEKETWVVRENGSGTRAATDGMFKNLGIAPARLMEFGSIQLIKESVEAGLGISLLSHWAIKKELRMNTLKIIKIEGLPFIRRFSIVTASPYKTKALDTFLDLVKKEKFSPINS